MKFRIRKKLGEWLVEHAHGGDLYELVITAPTHEAACMEMDHEVWLMNRDLFPGKTLTESRRRYRKGRLGSHVEKDAMRGVRAQVAVAGGPALGAGALVLPVREDG